MQVMHPHLKRLITATCTTTGERITRENDARVSPKIPSTKTTTSSSTYDGLAQVPVRDTTNNMSATDTYTPNEFWSDDCYLATVTQETRGSFPTNNPHEKWLVYYDEYYQREYYYEVISHRTQWKAPAPTLATARATVPVPVLAVYVDDDCQDSDGTEASCSCSICLENQSSSSTFPSPLLVKTFDITSSSRRDHAFLPPHSRRRRIAVDRLVMVTLTAVVLLLKIPIPATVNSTWFKHNPFSIYNNNNNNEAGVTIKHPCQNDFSSAACRLVNAIVKEVVIQSSQDDDNDSWVKKSFRPVVMKESLLLTFSSSSSFFFLQQRQKQQQENKNKNLVVGGKNDDNFATQFGGRVPMAYYVQDIPLVIKLVDSSPLSRSSSFF